MAVNRSGRGAEPQHRLHRGERAVVQVDVEVERAQERISAIRRRTVVGGRPVATASSVNPVRPSACKWSSSRRSSSSSVTGRPSGGGGVSSRDLGRGQRVDHALGPAVEHVQDAVRADPGDVRRAWQLLEQQRLGVLAGRGAHTQTISVPPEVSLTQVVSARRASASPSRAATLGTHWMRTNQETSPSSAGSVRPVTRICPAARSRLYRRATVWSDTPSTAAILLNGARPSTWSAWRTWRSSSSKTGDEATTDHSMSNSAVRSRLGGPLRLRRRPWSTSDSEENPMPILVTGARGGVGRAVLDQLLATARPSAPRWGPRRRRTCPPGCPSPPPT